MEGRVSLEQTVNRVLEFQGLYGPVTISERLLQTIWLKRQLYQENMRTLSGKSLCIRHPGRWNLQEGPDFREACLELDGVPLQGDVEIHFFEKEWVQHGHQNDPHYDNVVLHAVLFHPREGEPTARTGRGERPEVLVLLDYLLQDLEEYASEDTLLRLERREHSDLWAKLLELPRARRLETVRAKARLRWDQKWRFARKRLESHGWEEALHQFTLEILGYRRNRAPMSDLALRHRSAHFGDCDPAALYRELEGKWRLQGLRPHNHPRRRLEQYTGLRRSCSRWPERVSQLGRSLPIPDPLGETRLVRREVKLPQWQQSLRRELWEDRIGESRFHTWMVDGLLPLISAESGKDFFGLWYHWPSGDMPEALRRFLHQSELIGDEQVCCNGLMQGGLQLFLESGL